MVQESEVVTTVLVVGVFAFLVLGRARVRAVPGWPVFLSAFAALAAGTVLTVLEDLFWPNVLNLLEHVCYAVHSALLAVWCWRYFVRRGEAAQ